MKTDALTCENPLTGRQIQVDCLLGNPQLIGGLSSNWHCSHHRVKYIPRPPSICLLLPQFYFLSAAVCCSISLRRLLAAGDATARLALPTPVFARGKARRARVSNACRSIVINIARLQSGWIAAHDLISIRSTLRKTVAALKREAGEL